MLAGDQQVMDELTLLLIHCKINYDFYPMLLQIDLDRGHVLVSKVSSHNIISERPFECS